MNEDILPLRITQLTPTLIEKARTELNETQTNRQKSLAELRQMIENDPKLTSLTDDIFLLAFLRAKKFSVKGAFQLLQNYWSFRKDHRNIYDTSEYLPVKELILRSFVGLLEYRDKDGCLVFLTKFGLWDPSVDSYGDLFRAITAILIYAMQHEATQIAGFRMIFDTRGISWTQIKYLTFPNISLLFKAIQFCYPGRYKGMHILSDNKIINFMWSLISPFLTSKMKRRVFFHGKDLSPLREFIHPSILPREFGGDAPLFNNNSWEEIIDDVQEQILKQLNYGYKDLHQIDTAA